MLNFFQIKCPKSNPLIALKGVQFFDDIDKNLDYPILRNPLSFKEITARIKESVLKIDKIF